MQEETENSNQDEIEERDFLNRIENIDQISDPVARVAIERHRIELGSRAEVHPRGGLQFKSTAILTFQRKIMWKFIKDVGVSFASGKTTDLVSISLPVEIFEPRSFLQRLTDSWIHSPDLLQKASNCSDPLERFKFVVAFAVSGLRYMCSQWKPFNPILGETFQAEFEDGTLAFLEQTSHHPPITNWQLFGKDKKYHFFGYSRWEA